MVALPHDGIVPYRQLRHTFVQDRGVFTSISHGYRLTQFEFPLLLLLFIFGAKSSGV
jgi:hypothetical protein